MWKFLLPVITLSRLSFSIRKGPRWRGVFLTRGRSFSLTLHTISEAMASNSRMKTIYIECCNQEFCINSFHFGISLVFNSFLTFTCIFNVLTLKFIFLCVLGVMFLFHLCLGIPLLSSSRDCEQRTDIWSSWRVLSLQSNSRTALLDPEIQTAGSFL